jgi:uncharacterized protein YbbC (DUF1343 family)
LFQLKKTITKYIKFMYWTKKLFFLQIFILFILDSCAYSQNKKIEIKPAAWRTEQYVHFLKDKNIAVVANPSSTIGEVHLIDSLLNSGVHISFVFAPEHGFRGLQDAGEKFDNKVDPKTGLEIISLYGNNKKPSNEDLKGVDLVLFDIQDVGVRFYTYLSTLHYVMEACAENNIKFMILDRPNPNANYIDGPILDADYKSFVGMHPVPIVYGMTLGEFAMMINGEAWLSGGVNCDLQVIPCENYSHASPYILPVPPSPNLPTANSVNLYPSLCLFEGTVISVGRGTDFPFEVYGHPDLPETNFSFIPESRPGFALHPKYEGEKCYGVDLRLSLTEKGRMDYLSLKELIGSYNAFPRKEEFFNSYLEKLAGNKVLQRQIESGMSEDEIRKSWQKDLDHFKEIRKKYLIYK